MLMLNFLLQEEAFVKIKAKYKELYTDISELKEEQGQIVKYIIDGKDTFVNLPTGFGKSLTYVLPPLMLDEVRPMIKVYNRLMYYFTTHITSRHKK